MNSNSIRSALKIMNRVYELRTAGLKLKESKSDLRVILCELYNELPADILFNVEKVLKRRSGRDFFNHLSTVIYCAEASLRVSEQMDAMHAEALAMNDEFNIANVNAARVQSQYRNASQEHQERWVEEAHTEALRINGTSAQDQAITQTLARQNSLSHKIGLAFAGAALVFSSLVSPAQAEVVPSYPVDASRMSLEGSVAVSIDCSTRTVDVIRESTGAAYFSKQVKKQVANICYGQEGTLDRVYIFKMNKRVGAHDMMVNNTGRWTL